ncbi:unnamed protein product [Urochloa decumbens]|uniref:F-box domain-containing protein n=1 Tax=Urochloa decumbens TaxID=240449 RepID=A0ABC8YK67_9POAL
MSSPALMEDLVEEILLRFPPHEPACLVRAALVCKRWCRFISGPGFRRRFRELHRTPPLLGFLYRSLIDSDGANLTRFVPTAAFCSPQVEIRSWRPLDARHGRVLFRSPLEISDLEELMVWDPITDEKRKLPIPPRNAFSWTAAVLCSGAGSCDHLDCHRGPFLVVFVGSDSVETFIYTYSSDAAAWSKPICIQDAEGRFYSLMRSPLVGNALYFGFSGTNKALKYDMELREMFWIQLPSTCSNLGLRVLTTTEDGRLGLVTADGNKIYMWSRKAGSNDAGWTQNRVIELERLLPSDAILTSPDVLCFAEGIHVIFVRSNNVLFTIDLKACKVKKVCKGKGIRAVVPYMNFYTPELGAACAVEEPSVGGSSA